MDLGTARVLNFTISRESTLKYNLEEIFMSRLCVFFCLTMFFLTGCTTQNYEKDINLKTMGPEIKKYYS